MNPITLRFGDDRWAVALDAGLKQSGMTDAERDQGYATIDLQQRKPIVVGRADNVRDTAEVYDLVLNQYEKYRPLWGSTTGLAIFWDLPPREEQPKPLQGYVQLIDEVIATVQDVLKRQGISAEHPRYAWYLAAGLRVAMDEKKQTKAELKQLHIEELLRFADDLRSAGRKLHTGQVPCSKAISLTEHIVNHCQPNDSAMASIYHLALRRAGLKSVWTIALKKGDPKPTSRVTVRDDQGQLLFPPADYFEWQFPSPRITLATWYLQRAHALENQKGDDYGSFTLAAMRLMPENPDAHLSYGTWLFLKSTPDFAAARAQLEGALQLFPNFPAAHLYLGHLHRLADRPEEALKEYEKVIAANAPKELVVDVLTKAVDIHLRIGQKKEAAAICRRLEAMDPNNFELREYLSSFYVKLDEKERAIIQNKAAIRLDPKKAIPYHNLGWLLRETRKYHEAVKAYKQAIALAPDNPESYLGLANSYLELKDVKRAQQISDQAWQLFPTHSMLARQRAFILRVQNRTEEALQMLDGLAKKGIDESWIHGERGLILLNQDKAKEAVVHLRRAVELDPKLDDVRSNLGFGLLLADEPKAALEAFVLVDPSRLSPENIVKQYVGHSEALAKLGKFEEAVAIATKALTLTPQSPESYLMLSSILANGGQLDEALAAAQGAVKRAPKLSAVYWNLGDIYERLEKYEEAIAATKRAIELDPKNIGLKVNLATLKMKMGRYEEARRLAETILRSTQERELIGYAWTILGDSHRLRDEVDRAIAAYTKAREYLPGFSPMLMGLGRTLERRGDLDGAEAMFREACQADPKQSDCHNALGALAFTRKHYDEAMAHYRRASEVNPKDAAAQNGLGSIYFERRDYPQAINHYLQASILYPEAPGPHYNLGLVYYQTQEYKAAALAFERTIALNENHRDAYNYLYLCYNYLGLHLNVLNVLRQTKPWEKNTPRYLEHLYQTYMKMNDMAQSEKALAKLRALDPKGISLELIDIHQAMLRRDFDTVRQMAEAIRARDKENALAYAYLAVVAVEAEKNLAKGRELAKKSIKLNPQQSFAYNTLGWIDLMEEKYDDAIKTFQKALQYDPGEPVTQGNLRLAESRKPVIKKIIPPPLPDLNQKIQPLPQPLPQLLPKWPLKQKREGVDILRW